MKRIANLFLLLFSILSFSIYGQKDYDIVWDSIEKLEVKNLPKSALKLVDSLYQKAEKDINTAQQIKALFYKSKFSLLLDENAQLAIISDFKTHIKSSTFPTKNILNNILANLYWQYFNQNRYVFYQRTQTAQKVDSVDFRTWDLQTLFKEIHTTYQQSLVNKKRLQQVTTDQFSAILHLEKDSKIYRPTLYDFLANNALEFYKTPENSITKPTDNFTIDNPQFLSDAKTFSKINLHAKDSLSLQFQALKTYQNLIVFHLNNNTLEALAIADIERLKFVKQYAVFQEKGNLYLQVLKESQKSFINNTISGLYGYEIASVYYDKGLNYPSTKNKNDAFKIAEALELCKQIINNFPKSLAAKKSSDLKGKIESKSLSIKAEEHLPINKNSRLLINYKNVNFLHFTSYKISENKQNQLNRIYNVQEQVAFIKKLPKVLTWSAKLRNEKDYMPHTTEVIVPKFDGGNYLIVASENNALNADEIFGITTIQVTNLAIIENHKDAIYQYQVVDRNTGKPVKKARINIQNPNRYSGGFINVDLITDKNGFATFKSRYTYNNCEITVFHKKDSAYFGNHYIYQYKQQIEKEKKPKHITIKPFVFTDRSIYRPGQTVYFKTIFIKNDGTKSTPFTNQYAQVELFSPNGELVKRIDLKLNEYGSAAGSFIIPDNGLTGEYYFEFDESEKFESDYSDTVDFEYLYENSILVEEYKRPKFKTDFKPIVNTFQVNDSVTITGFAKSFSDTNITDAKVAYKVTRKTQYPNWYFWRQPNRNDTSQEITFGETSTNNKGEFHITFKAVPDATILKENLPVFTYEITADVTDVNGETRSSTTLVNVGYHSLLATISLPSTINKNEKHQTISITTKNLNNEFTPAKGILKIYKLQAPKNSQRERIWNAPDYQDIPENVFRKLFPNEPYLDNENKEQNWERGSLVFQSDFDTNDKKELSYTIGKRWIIGKYIAVLESKDAFGQALKDQQFFNLFDPKANTVADNKLFTIHTDKSLYKPKDKIELHMGSASKDLTVTIQVKKNNSEPKTHIIHLNNETKKLKIPIKKDDIGTVSIHYNFVNYNEFNTSQLRIPIVKQETSIAIETTSFRDKLEPGQNETWSFTIKDDKKNGVAAEILASMYDASLDAFKGHNWQFQPIIPKEDYYYNNSNARQSFGVSNFTIKNNKTYYNINNQLTFDTFNWFGFSFNENKWFQRRYLQRTTLKQQSNSNNNTPIIKQSGNFNGVISGTVSDESGALPGVSVLIRGNQVNGTETDFDGNFSIVTKKGDILVISYIGYKTVEITVGNASHLEILMSEDANNLDEVVVTALGVEREKASLGFAVQGKVAGITITEKEKAIMDLSTVKARRNLEETAFFYPQLSTDKNGNISFNFTVPESLTEWKLQLLAHTKNLLTASKTLTTVTQKELMVVPNAPRFLRQGDQISLSAKISNLSPNQLNGFAQLQLTDPITGKEIDIALQNLNNVKKFTIDTNENTNVSWDLTVPTTVQAVQYKIIAKAGDFSDGEQNILPVLSNRMLVTETLPIWLKSNETKTFTLDKLKNNTSTTLKNHKLTFEVSSNPAWYAVQALPYLMEYPYECAEQTFSKYYANTLASFVLNSNPRIHEVFKSWKSSEALISNLEKNQELKSILIQETPWLRDAQSETQQKKRIALLFDLNLMKSKEDKAMNTLLSLQFSSGGFPWFKGSETENIFITQHIVSGFGHLKKLGVGEFDKSTKKMIEKAVEFSDNHLLKSYKKLLKDADKIKQKATTKLAGEKAAKKYLESNQLNYTKLQYLYMRSFYKDIVMDSSTQEAVNYYKNQSAKYWDDYNLLAKGQIALTHFRTGEKSVAIDILKSLKENSITSDELGMYWKSNTPGYYSYQSPIEAQALLIEAFSEIENDTKTIDNLKIWLLKNKQVNQWKTTKSTTEAVYALLLNGSDWISVTDMVDVQIGGKKIDPTQLDNVQVEAGTGYYKTSWYNEEIKPKMSEITVSKKGNGIAWGALYWQYFENLNKITSAETSLKINKKLFLKVNSTTGKTLKEITQKTQLKIGDLITVRIEISSDRTMEFIHLKDMRASGVEPINVLSNYKRQGNLGYYESTKDASTNFFFDTLPKGIHVFEYDVRVNQAGNFSNGITTIQSMYAPEFSSHSEGIRISSEK